MTTATTTIDRVLLVARYGSTCPGCGQRIYPGDYVTVNEGTRHAKAACTAGHHDATDAVPDFRRGVDAANRLEHWRRTGSYANSKRG